MSEQVSHDQLNQQQYVEQVLQRQQIVDSEAKMRDMYNFDGRNVIFRNHQETVTVPDTPYFVPEGPGQAVLPFEIDPATAESKWAAYKADAQTEADPAATMIVTNNPEGILAAASVLNPNHAAEFSKLAGEMSQGEYGPDAMKLIDSLAACSYMNEDGGVGTEVPIGFGTLKTVGLDAPAIVLRSLAGDEQATAIVEQRVEAMHTYLTKQRIGRLATGGTEYADWKSRQSYEVSAIPPENVALVHSTSHPIERDDAGNVVLYPASVKREDRFPRATLHFTPNSQVVQHFMAGDAFGAENRLIVGNLAGMMEANGSPAVINDVDTFFSVNPGEHVTIPGALVVEPAPKNQQDLIVVDGDKILYKQVEDGGYSEDDKRVISKLGQQFNDQPGIDEPLASRTREIALRQAMATLGVEPQMMARGGEHYSMNQRLNDALTALRYELGVEGGLHTYTPEAKLEMSVSQAGMRPTYEDDQYIVTDFSLPALRQVIASGYMPTRRVKQPVVVDPNSPYF